MQYSTKIRTRTLTKPRNGRGVDNSNWKGGRIKHLEYILTFKPDHPFQYVREHALVWEEHHNAILLPWADVHHKDENKQNNVWYNLQAMTHGTHRRFHVKNAN